MVQKALLAKIWMILGVGSLLVSVNKPWALNKVTLTPQEVSPSAPAQVLGIAHAVHLRPTLNYGKEIRDFTSLVGKQPAMVMYFMDWQGNPNASGLERYFDPYLVNTISNTFPISERPAIMLTWQPLHGRQATGCTQDYPGVIPLTDIMAEACDNYIRGFARALKARPERFLIRFAHEMNISDSPWWVGHIGAFPSLYVSVWRHVHRTFEEEGVTNVEWVWSPNYASNPPDLWNDLHAYYPGDDVVDWIGLSGYNWYNTRQPMNWRSFVDLYDAVLKDLACSYPKPQIIAEIGSVEGDGSILSKAGWIQNAYDHAISYPFLRAIQWFNDYAYADHRSADFRVTTGTAQDNAVQPLPPQTGVWTTSYRNAISNPVYRSTLPTLQAATPPGRLCGDVSFTLTPNLLLLSSTGEGKILLTGIGYTMPLTISLALPHNTISFSPRPDSLDPPWGVSELQIRTSNTPLGLYEGQVILEGTPGFSRTFSFKIKVVDRIYQNWLPMVRK